MGKESWERQRLKDLYSHLSDGELEEIASNWADLTDLAREGIKGEAERRGIILPKEEALSVPHSPFEGSEDSAPEVVTVGVFDNHGEATIVKGLLESAGIECFLTDGFQNRVTEEMTSPIGLPAIGGIQIRVKVADAAAAKEFLDQPIIQDPEDVEDLDN